MKSTLFISLMIVLLCTGCSKDPEGKFEAIMTKDAFVNVFQPEVKIVTNQGISALCGALSSDSKIRVSLDASTGFVYVEQHGVQNPMGSGNGGRSRVEKNHIFFSNIQFKQKVCLKIVDQMTLEASDGTCFYHVNDIDKGYM